MRTLWLMAALMAPLAAHPQEIYRWVDRNGVVHYSDQPGAPDAQLVDKSGFISTYEPVPAPYVNPDLAQPAGPAYRSLEIAEPEPDEVFFGAGQVISVRAELGGELVPGHSLVFFFNGNRVAESGDFSAELTGIERGSHFLRAAVLDESGSAVITSPQIQFHVRMPSVQNPQGGPQIRPPSKPGG